MKASVMALGGVTAALALVIMCLGGIIPLATYICPMLCCLVLQLIMKRLGKRMSWVWYGAVGLLCLLLGPDKEAAAVFLFLGYYPIIRAGFPKNWTAVLLKALYFNASTLAVYGILIHLLGMAEIAREFSQLGLVMTTLTLLLGNVTFFMLDRLLAMLEKKL